MRKQRKADFSVTNDVNAAIFSNLRKLSKGQKAKLTSHNEKAVARTQAAQKRLSVTGRQRVKRFEKSVEGVDAGVMASLTGQLQGVVRAGKVAAKGQAAAIKQNAKGSNDIVDIFNAGTKNLKANAEAATAQALSERAAVDAVEIARMKHEELMLQRQQDFQREMARKEFQRQTTLMGLNEDKARTEIGATFGQMKPAVLAFSKIVPEVLRLRGENPEMTLEQLREALMETGAIPAGEENSPVVQSLLYSLSNNDQPGKDDIVQEFIEAMSLNGNWSMLKPKAQKKLKAYIASSLSASVARYAQGYGATSGEGGGDHFKPFGMMNDLLGDAWNSAFVKAATLRGN